MVKNFLTFDLENWYDSDFVKKEDKKGKDFVLEGLKKVVKLLDKYNTKATFFVTGDVLKKYPKDVKSLYESGHEIASHSYYHIMLNKLSEKKIKQNIIRSKELIRRVTGKNPRGFRAPSWSINKKLFWVYDFLEKEGFSYSSSLFPVNVGAYGSFEFPTSAFNPNKNGKIMELPVRPFTILGVRLPFSGGTYFRIWPLWIIKFLTHNLNKKNMRVVFYIHPWELCPTLPRIKMSFLGRIISYYGIKNTEKKLDYILSEFKFDSIEKAINE